MGRNRQNKKNKAPRSTNPEQNAKNDADSGHNTPITSGTIDISPIIAGSTSDETIIIPETTKPEDIQTTKQQSPQKTWRKCTHRFCSYKTTVEHTKNCPMHNDIVLVKIKK